MGAKTPEQIGKSRPAVKCDLCQRKFLNQQALKTHHKFLHSKNEAPKRVSLKRQVDARPIKKKVVPVSMLKRVNPIPTRQANKTVEVTEKAPDLAGKLSNVSKKPEFECPICAEKFPVYFTAFRHIQKNHCVDDNGGKVAPNSPLLVKPIRIEVCASCRTLIRSTEPHNCPKQQANRDQYLCLGCEQVFSGLVLFQHHVKGLHADGAQNYFFPSRDEFTSWKADLQKQTNIEFIRLNKQKTKEIYHCSHHNSAVTATTKLCPSTITVREYTKGVHVCYYKEHHGHTVENVLLKKYSQHCISLYTRETEDLKLEAEDDNDLYLQFKKMVTCVVLDAAKVDVTTLKELLGKALEMTSVLKHYEGEERYTRLISKCLTDTQISRTLDSLKPHQGKRKLSTTQKDTKKVELKKVRKESIEKSVENGVNTKSQKNKKNTDDEQHRSSPVLNKSVSFNKSKKNEETLRKKDSDLQKKTEETPLKSALRKTEPPLQKILAKKIEEPKVIEVEVPVPVTPLPRSQLQSPSSFNDSYKNFVDQNFKTHPDTSTPKGKANVKKKVVKTKIGQFKVKTSVSPKDLSPKVSPKEFKIVKELPVTPVTPKAWKTKPDIQYEVKEQENDCNILILKI